MNRPHGQRPARPSAPSDAELLVRSGGDATAFAELYDRHVAALLSFFYRRTGCAETSADLTAETFAQAFASRRRFRDVGAPGRAWLFKIARRQLAKFVRRQRVATRSRNKLRVRPCDLTPGDYERIETLAEADSWRPLLVSALAELPKSQADAVRLRIVDELPYAAVADALHCSEGAARVRVSRGLSHLADLMEVR